MPKINIYFSYFLFFWFFLKFTSRYILSLFCVDVDISIFVYENNYINFVCTLRDLNFLLLYLSSLPHMRVRFRRQNLYNTFIHAYPPELSRVELVSKELNHFGVIADLFRQIGDHSSRFMPFCSFWRFFTIKMIKSVKVFPFSFFEK